MKKILVLSSFPAPYRMDVFQRLRKTYQLDIFFTSDKDQNRSKDYFAKKCTNDYYVINNDSDKKEYLNKLKKIYQYDMVLAYDWYLPHALWAEMLCILFRVPYVVNCDGAFIDEDHGLKEVIKSFFIKRAKVCLASGKYARNYFLKYGAKEENIRLHPFTSLHEADMLVLPPDDDMKKRMRSILKLPERKTVLAIGQFIPRKGFDVLLDAWGDLDLNYHLLLIGGGELEESYSKQIQENGYRNVTILGFVSPDMIKQYYIAADLFVLPTREDIWGLVINEAMAYGVPVITTNKCVAGMELIEDEKNGFVIDVEDVQMLKQKMHVILANNLLSSSMSISNISKIKQYTVENVVREHIKCFDELI